MNFYKLPLLLLGLLFAIVHTSAQNLTAKEILDKSISFHDPEGLWYRSQIELKLKGEYASGLILHTDIEIAMPAHDFVSQQVRSERNVVRKIQGDSCFHSIDGNTDIRQEEKMRLKLTCKQTARMRNYNIYLYGLPMKLQDESARLHPEVETEQLNGKTYHVLKVSYAPEVGIDIWRFFINPQTFEMEAYQFYKKEADQKGEMIFLEGLTQVASMKLPKKRTWYDWPAKKLLGTDIVVSGTAIANP